MPNTAYQAPVAQLLTQGCPDSLRNSEGLDYLQTFGITEAHIPELSQLAAETDLNWEDEEERYAPIHACRALGQLKTETAIQALLPLFDSKNDWLREDLHILLERIGPICIPILSGYLAEVKHPWLGISTAATGLTKIALAYPEHRQECTGIITAALARHKEQSPEANGSLVYQLLDLEAVEAASVIERAYKEGPMDEMICGSWARVQIALGLASASDFTPEELQHKEPEWVENLRRKITMPTGLTSDPNTLHGLGKSVWSQNQQKPMKKTTGFGVVKPKNKKRKKKR